MFLIKKRRISYIILLLLLISAQDIFCQSEKVSIEDYKELVINGEIVYLPVYPKNNLLLTNPVFEDPVLKDDIVDEFSIGWNNQRFNPYRGEKVSFPFRLSFESENFSNPVSRKMVITSRYGWRRGRPHQGIDIDLQVGDSVRSILGGKVRYARYHGGHGNTIVVRHHNGLETVYAHLSKFLVKENDEIEKGQVIAKGGITGNARGSHLHLEVRYHGRSINPEYLFEFNEEAEIRSDVLYVTRKWTTPRYHKSTRKSNIVIHETIDDIVAFQEQQQKTYTVRKGDTLHRIASQHGLAVSEICKINAIKYNSVLKIGQEIIIN